MKYPRIRTIEFQWNLDGPLEYTSPQDIVKWVKESGLNGSINDIEHGIVDHVNSLYKHHNPYDKSKYAEYRCNGVAARINYMDACNWDYYMEIWKNDAMVMMTRIQAGELHGTTSGNAAALSFLSHCVLYISMMLVDSALWEDSTDSNNNMAIEEDFMKKTKVFRDTFKGYKMFGVWETDEKGEKVGKYPLVAVGTRKAAALAAHADELNQFVVENSDGSATTKYNTTKLDEDEREQLKVLMNKMS